MIWLALKIRIVAWSIDLASKASLLMRNSRRKGGMAMKVLTVSFLLSCSGESASMIIFALVSAARISSNFGRLIFTECFAGKAEMI